MMSLILILCCILPVVISKCFYTPDANGEVVIPANITTIASKSFQGCTALKTLIFAEGSQLTSIEFISFVGSNLQGSINIPAGCKTIGSSAFKDLKITTVTFGSGTDSQLTNIGASSFENTLISSNSI